MGNLGKTTFQRLRASMCIALTSKNISTSLKTVPHPVHGFHVDELATQEWSKMMSVWANVHGCFTVSSATF